MFKLRLLLLAMLCAGLAQPALAEPCNQILVPPTPTVPCNPDAIANAAPLAQDGEPQPWPTDAGQAQALAAQYAKRANLDMQCGNYRDAQSLFSIALEQLSTRAVLWSERGANELQSGDDQDGLNDYQKAIDLITNKQDAQSDEIQYRLNFYQNRAVAEQLLGQFQAAIDDYNHVQRNPDGDQVIDLQPPGVNTLRKIRAELALHDSSDAYNDANDLWNSAPNFNKNWCGLYLEGIAGMGFNEAIAVDSLENALQRLEGYIGDGGLNASTGQSYLADVYAKLGDAYAGPGQKHDWRMARTAYQKALTYDAANTDATNGLQNAPQPSVFTLPPDPALNAIPSVADLQQKESAAGFCTQSARNDFIVTINKVIDDNADNITATNRAIDANNNAVDALKTDPTTNDAERADRYAQLHQRYERLSSQVQDESNLDKALRDFEQGVLNSSLGQKGCQDATS